LKVIKTRPKLRLSVVIPTYNESDNIEELLEVLASRSDESRMEVIVMDSPKTTDATGDIAKNCGAQVHRCAQGSRACQLHAGVAKATNEVLFFVHADTRPPENFDELIYDSLAKGNDFGMFSYRFDKTSRLLDINSSTTRKKGVFTGGGDQGMFIRKETYLAQGGFNTELCIMEDFDFYWRLKKAKVPFEIIPQDMLVSARKYERNSYLRVQLVNLATVLGFKLGVNPKRLKKMYVKQLG